MMGIKISELADELQEHIRRFELDAPGEGHGTLGPEDLPRISAVLEEDALSRDQRIELALLAHHAATPNPLQPPMSLNANRRLAHALHRDRYGLMHCSAIKELDQSPMRAMSVERRVSVLSYLHSRRLDCGSYGFVDNLFRTFGIDINEGNMKRADELVRDLLMSTPEVSRPALFAQLGSGSLLYGLLQQLGEPVQAEVVAWVNDNFPGYGQYEERLLKDISRAPRYARSVP